MYYVVFICVLHLVSGVFVWKCQNELHSNTDKILENQIHYKYVPMRDVLNWHFSTQTISKYIEWQGTLLTSFNDSWNDFILYEYSIL